MATAGAVRAGRAFVEAYLDDRKLIAGLNATQRKLKKWGASIATIGASLTAVGTAAAAPFILAAKHFATAGDSMSKMSRRTGVAVETLSALEYAAGQSGATAEDLEKGLRGMNKTLVAAAQGSKDARKTLEALGLSMAQLEGKTPDQQFTIIAEALSKLPDHSKAAAAALDIFGRSGAQLLPLLLEGANGIKSLTDRAYDLGVIMREDDTKAAVELGDLWDDLVRIFKHGAFVIGAALAPTLIRLANEAITVAAATLKWVDANRPLIVTVAKIVAGVVAAGVVFTALGVGIIALGAVFGGLATIISTASAAIAIIGSAIGFLLSPIGLVIAAATALGVWLVTSTGVGAAAVEWLSGVFGDLATDVGTAFDAIRAALSGGDLAAAAQVLWATLKLEWTKGTAFLTQKLVEARGAMQSIWGDLMTNLSKAWVDFLVRFQTGRRKAQDAIAKGILELFLLSDPSLEKGVRAVQAEIDNMSKADLAPVIAGGEATKREIDAQNERDSAARNQRSDRDIAASRSELEKAQAAFDAAVMGAKAAGDGNDGGGPRVPDWMAELLKLLEGGMSVASVAATDRSGTFSSETNRMFAGGAEQTQRQIAENTRETTRLLGRYLPRGGLNYGY